MSTLHNLTLDNPLADYVSSSQHRDHAIFALLVARYQFLKAISTDLRLKGNIQEAVIVEDVADKIGDLVDDAEAGEDTLSAFAASEYEPVRVMLRKINGNLEAVAERINGNYDRSDPEKPSISKVGT